MSKYCPDCDLQMADNEDNCENCEQINDEIIRLTAMVDQFSKRMKEKLVAKANRRFAGWDCESYRADLERKLFSHAMRGIQGDGNQWLDVANFAAFLDGLTRDDD